MSQLVSGFILFQVHTLFGDNGFMVYTSVYDLLVCTGLYSMCYVGLNVCSVCIHLCCL